MRGERRAVMCGLLLAGGLARAAAQTASSRPAAGIEWLRGPDMLYPEAFPSGASVDGRFYLIGGEAAQANQVFDPETGEWSPLAPPPINRSLAQAVAIGPTIYVFGGCLNSDCSHVVGDNWAYDTVANTWTRKAPMPLPRQGMASAAIRGRIYVAGGYLGRYQLSAALAVYDPIADVWTTKSSMPLARAYGGAGAIDGELYYAGGTDNGWGQQLAPHADVMAYDPLTDGWSMRAPMPASVSQVSGAVLDGKLYIAGGSDHPGGSTTETWAYDPARDSWSAGPATNMRHSNTVMAAGKRMLFAVGEATGQALPASSTFEYAAPPGFAARHPRRPSRAQTGDGQLVVKRAPLPGLQAPRHDFPAHPQVQVSPLSDVDNPSTRGPQRPHDFALVIGIETYSVLPEARYAEHDADAMKNRLLALGYPQRNIILLKGGRATHGALQGYVQEWLPKNVRPDSRVFVYFSGHGSPDPENGDAYLVPWDGDAMFLKSTAYPLKSLYASLAKLKVKHVLVALDSCFSGAGGRSVLVAGARPLVSRISQIPSPAGVTVLSAASGDEITGTLDEQGHGAFTYYLLKALEDGKLTASAAYDELKPNVQDEAHRMNREQTPLMLGDDASF